jgi:hypothetical protein
MLLRWESAHFFVFFPNKKTCVGRERSKEAEQNQHFEKQRNLTLKFGSFSRYSSVCLLFILFWVETFVRVRRRFELLKPDTQNLLKSLPPSFYCVWTFFFWWEFFTEFNGDSVELRQWLLEREKLSMQQSLRIWIHGDGYGCCAR